MENITKQQIMDIINNRPEGTTPEGIIAELRNRGHELEGYPTTALPTAEKVEEKPAATYAVQNTQFLRRLKLGFGGPSVQEQKKTLEEELGLRGKFDVGDIADIMGDLFPWIGGFAGAALGAPAAGVGAIPGAAIGVGAGEAAKRGIGQILGVRKEIPLGQEAIETGTAAGVTYVGGKILDVLLRPVIKFIGERVPERLYSMIFKQSKDDLVKELQPQALKQLQKTNPEIFAEYVRRGFVRVDTKGNPVPNPTFATEALQEGLRGNPRTMARISYLKQLDYEKQIRDIATPDKLITITNKKGYIDALRLYTETFQKHGLGTNPERIANAQELLKRLQTSPENKIDAETALWLRRYIDGMRNTRSFVEDVSLTPKQEALKTLADSLRGNIAEQLPGAKEVMNKYRFYIEAFDSLVDYAVRTENVRLLTLTDVIIGGGGMAGGFPGTGLGMAAAVRGFQQPWTLTGLGQLFSKMGPALQAGIIPGAIGIGQAMPDDPFGIRGKIEEAEAKLKQFGQ